MPSRTQRLLLLSALAGVTYPLVPRGALAGQCSPSAGLNIVCAGPLNAATDVTQTLTNPGGSVFVTTAPGFGIDTSVSGGDAIDITVNSGTLSFDDQNASTITAAEIGISAIQNGAGSLTITATGAITGVAGDGITAQNNGASALVIDVAAVDGGAMADGIQATNGSITDAAGTDIDITTSGPVEGGQMGIIARNYGTGEITITSTGPVTVTGGVIGDQWAGLFARNGNIAGDGTVTYAGTNITITASGDVTGFYNGVAAYNFGTGSNVVTVTGTVLGKAQAGILARNGIFDPPGPATGPVRAGTYISVRAEGDVRGAFQGIRVDNVGTGHIDIVALASVQGDAVDGIQAHNSEFGTYLTINANNVSGGTDGINALNEGSGLLSVTTTGTVTGITRNGILLATAKTNAELTVSGMVTGAIRAVDAIDVYGTLRLEVQPGYGFSGIVDARNAIIPLGNRIVLGGPSGEASFDLSAIAGDIPALTDVFFGFDDIFLKEDASNFILLGANRVGAEFEEAAVTGTGLAVLGEGARLVMDAGADPFAVQSGGLGAIGTGSLLDGDVSVSGLGAIVLGNGGPFDPVSGLAGAGDIFTLSGDFSSDGGGLFLDTYFDDGTANLSDRLVVAGGTSGTTFVFADNAGGPGGITGQGSTDGIKVVDVAGSSAGLFVLGKPAYGGAFEYGLFQADGQDWYLQTTNLRDQAVMAPYIPYSLRAFGDQITGTYFERTGTRIGWQTDPAAASPSRHGAWGRVLGAWSTADGTLLDGFNDVSYDESFWALQAGADAVISESGPNRLVASAFLHYGGIANRSTNELTGLRAGSVDTNGIGGGASLTFETDQGFYLDGLASYTFYYLDMSASDGASGSTDASGWTVSGEVGQAFRLANRVTLTPQAQLTYQGIAIDTFVDDAGVVTSFSDTNSLEGRLGLRLEVAHGPAPSTTRFHFGANLLHEFLDSPVATVAGTPLALGFDDSGYELELGATFATADGRFSAWVQGDYSAPFSASDGIATWNATGGFAVRF